MGFKLAEAVYKIGREATTPTEQAVLVALAFRANDNTLLCYPKQDTLVEMTHLSRSTVAAALKSLHKKQFVSWVRGGNKVKYRGHGGAVSNSYRLNTALISDLYARRRKARKAAVTSATAPDIPQKDLTPPCDLDPPARKHFSPVRRLMADLGFVKGTQEYRDNFHVFAKLEKIVGLENARKIVMNLEADFRNNEFDPYDNVPAIVTTRFQDAARLGYVEDYSRSV